MSSSSQNPTPEYRFVRGYEKNPDNPGLLITHNRAKFSLNKSNKSGDLLTYHCSTKHITKCSAKCQVVVLSFENEKRYVLSKFSELSQHNHETSKGEIMALQMILDMENNYISNLTEKASVVRKKVTAEYLEKYGGTDIWEEILEHLQDDSVIDRRLNKVREKVWGNLPKGRDDFDILKVLETVQGGKDVVVMDSNDLRSDPEYREKLEEIGVGDEELENLPRVLSISSEFGLNLLTLCKKASVDGTFRIAPTNWSQIFIFMVKYDDKFVPICFGFLPNKTEISYTIFFTMIQVELEKRNLNCSLKKIMVDFEIGIQKAIISVFDVEILACFFHFSQCLWKRVQSGQMSSLYEQDEKFREFIRACISLPMLKLEELQDAVDELKTIDFNDEIKNNNKDKFMKYIQDVWIDGMYPPQTWCCFSRKEDNTNNPQEAYNGVLNRLLQVAHPNPCLLLTKLVAELNNMEYLVQKSKKAKKIIVRKTKYQILFDEKEILKQKYHKNLISRQEYLKSMGHKLRKLDKEAVRNRSVDNDSNDIQELPSLRIRIARSENEQLRLQEISENQINHEKLLGMKCQDCRLITPMSLEL